MDDFKAFLERLKEAAKIEEIVAETGKFQLVRSGKYWRTKEHDSLSIDPVRGWFEWYSKGTGPGARGDVLEWLQHHGGYPDFMDAVRWLSDRTGVRYEWSEAETRKYQARRARMDALTLIAQFMAELLHKESGKGALAYAQGRGWEDETISEAGLGFWSWDKELKGQLRGHLQMHEVDPTRPEAVAILGFEGDVLTWGEKWEIPRDRIDQAWIAERRIPGAPPNLLVYPHWEGRRCVYLAGRRLDWKEDDPWPKSWNVRSAFVGGKRPYWNRAHDAASDYVVVVEGQGDAVTLQEWEIPSVALAGARADKHLIERLRRHERVYVALDSDAAGESGSRLLAEELGPATLIVTWPGGGDANDWLKHGATAHDCQKMLAEAPIYALYMAQQLYRVSQLERENARRFVYELIASLMPYDYARYAIPLAVAMGHISDSGAVRTADLNKIIRAIKTERDLAAMGVEEAKPVKEAATKPVHTIYGELTPELEEVLLSRSRDHEGHARCVKALYGDKLAFVPEWGWLFYNGKFWDREGAEHKAQGLVVRTLKMRRHLGTEKEIEHLVKATPASKSNVVSTQSLLERLVLAKTSDFDNVPNYLNCANGVVDLRTGELLAHDSLQYRFTYCLPTAYKPGADYTDWLLFLGQVTGEADRDGLYYVDKELLDWLQMAVGYSLTGHTSEGCLFYLYGPTRSGKGTFTQTLQKLLGKPLAAGIDFNILVQQRGEDAQNFALAPLKPCRILVGSEPGKYERFNEAKMKALTGEDTVRCSFKQKDHFEYDPQFKIWLSSNWPFNADTSDAAAWGRARIIRFPNSFLGQEDKHLKVRLQQGMEGILAWAVEGSRAWFASEKGLVTPPAVESETKEQRVSQDYIQQFLDDCCEVDGESFTSSKELYKVYKLWCDGELTAQKPRSFSLSLQAKGIGTDKSYVNVQQSFFNGNGEGVTRKQARGYRGVRLNESGAELLLGAHVK